MSLLRKILGLSAPAKNDGHSNNEISKDVKDRAIEPALSMPALLLLRQLKGHEQEVERQRRQVQTAELGLVQELLQSTGLSPALRLLLERRLRDERLERLRHRADAEEQELPADLEEVECTALVLGCRSPALALALLPRLSQASLQKVACANVEKSLARAACEKLSDKESLQVAVRSARSNTVRLLARKRLEALQKATPAADTPAADTVSAAASAAALERRLHRYDSLRRTLRALAEHDDYTALGGIWERSCKEYEALAATLMPEEAAELSPLLRQCHERAQEQQSRRLEELARSDRQAQLMGAVENLLSRLSALAPACPDPQPLRDLQEEWTSLDFSSCPTELAQSAQKRYAAALQDYVKAQRRLVKMMTDSDKNMEQLNALCVHLESLTGGTAATVHLRELEELNTRFTALLDACGSAAPESVAAFLPVWMKLLDDRRQSAAATPQALAELIAKFESLAEPTRDTVPRWRAFRARLEKERLRHDLDAAQCARFEELDAAYTLRVQAWEQEQDALDFARLTACQALVEEMEAADAAGISVAQAFNMLKDYQNRWKEIGAFAKERGEDIRVRYKTISDKIFAIHRDHAQARRAELEQHALAKTALCEQAEALSASTQWNETAAQLQELQEQWKLIGPAPKEQSEALWTRFRNACQHFYNERNEHYKKRRQEQGEVKGQKRQIIDRALAIGAKEQYTKEDLDALKALQTEWKQAGHAGGAMDEQLWKEFRQCCDKVFTAFHEVRHQRQDELKTATRSRQSFLEEFERRLQALVAAGEWTGVSALIHDAPSRWRDLPHAGARQAALAERFEKLRRHAMDERKNHFQNSPRELTHHQLRADELYYRIKLLRLDPHPGSEQPQLLEKLMAKLQKQAPLQAYITTGLEAAPAAPADAADLSRGQVLRLDLLCRYMEELAGVEIHYEEEVQIDLQAAAKDLAKAFASGLGGGMSPAVKAAPVQTMPHRQAEAKFRDLLFLWTDEPLDHKAPRYAELYQRFSKAVRAFIHKIQDERH